MKKPEEFVDASSGPAAAGDAAAEETAMSGIALTGTESGLPDEADADEGAFPAGTSAGRIWQIMPIVLKIGSTGAGRAGELSRRGLSLCNACIPRVSQWRCASEQAEKQQSPY